MNRIILGGLLGGILLFLWEGLAHEVLPLGEAGIKGFSNQAVVLASLKENVKESGFYIFPWMEETPGMTSDQKKQAMQAAMEKGKQGPTGLMMIHPQGRDYSMPKLLGAQFVFDLAAMLLAAFLVSWCGVLKSYGSRLFFVTALGLFPVLSAHLPQWNWYGFPGAYTSAQAVMDVVGFLLGGLAVAGLVRPARYI